MIVVCISGVLAWRKLLMNTKPLKKTRHGIMRYYKTGDFENALKDFLSVVPMDNKTFKQLGDAYKVCKWSSNREL